MDLSKLTFEEVTKPSSYEAQEGLRQASFIFELSPAQSRGIVQNLLDPKSVLPNHFHFIAAILEEKIVGMAFLYYLTRDSMGYLDYIAVVPEYRGKGIGKQLYLATVKLLKEKYDDVAGIFIEVSNAEKGLKIRKEFFLEQGCIPIDLSFYQSIPDVSKSGILTMIHPLQGNLIMNNKKVKEVMKDLSATLCHKNIL